jgi:GNAT superfamily N-acetyltransferase
MSHSHDILYGPATAADLSAVVDLCMQVEEQHENYWPLRWQRRPGLREGYLRWMSRRLDDPRMFIHVARDPALRTPADLVGESTPCVVGMILVTINDEIPIYTYSEFALVQDMAVLASHRRRGIAQRLLKDAADWSRAHGLNQLRLMVADKNPAAQGTFKKAGFQPTYIEMILPLKDEGKAAQQ